MANMLEGHLTANTSVQFVLCMYLQKFHMVSSIILKGCHEREARSFWCISNARYNYCGSWFIILSKHDSFPCPRPVVSYKGYFITVQVVSKASTFWQCGVCRIQGPPISIIQNPIFRIFIHLSSILWYGNFYTTKVLTNLRNCNIKL